jgi:hypothetical protein
MLYYRYLDHASTANLVPKVHGVNNFTENNLKLRALLPSSRRRLLLLLLSSSSSSSSSSPAGIAVYSIVGQFRLMICYQVSAYRDFPQYCFYITFPAILFCLSVQYFVLCICTVLCCICAGFIIVTCAVTPARY